MRIRVRLSFFVYLLLVALLSSLETVLAALYALTAHELGHLLAGKLAGEQITGIELTPFGGVLQYAAGKSARKGIRGVAVAVAGPAANYLFIMLLIAPASAGNVQSTIGQAMTEKLIVANTSMFLLNLLPALPLDGGRIVLSIGFYLFQTAALIRVLCVMGCTVGTGLVLGAFYGLYVYGTLNCSMIVVGVYLFGCALGSRDALIYENAYAVIKERQGAQHMIRRAQVYAVPADTKLHTLMPAILRAPAAVFVYEQDGGRRYVFEDELLQALLDTPARTIGEMDQIIRNNTNKTQNWTAEIKI